MNDRKLVSVFYRSAFPLSLVLLALSFAVHLITFAPINEQDEFPFVFLLHVGIFALGVPLVFIDRVLKKSPSMAGYDDSYKHPAWIWVCFGLLAAYVAFNFFYFLIAGEGQPEMEAGRYWLKNKSVVIRELTRQEYDAESARILHGFSGHWLIFYLYIAWASYAGKKSLMKRVQPIVTKA